MNTLDPAALHQEARLNQLNALKEAQLKVEMELESLTEKGKKLDVEKQELVRMKQREIDENSRLVEVELVKARKLEEEKNALLLELPFVGNYPNTAIVQTGNAVEVIKLKKPSLPNEIFILIAHHLPAKDQLALRSLNKRSRKAIPKVLLLNYRYFMESFRKLAPLLSYEMLISEIPVYFNLNPNQVKFDPYGMLEIVGDILHNSRNSSLALTAIHALLGASLMKKAVTEVLGRSHQHPKFKYLTLQIAALANCSEAVLLLLPSRDNRKDRDYSYALSASSMAGNDHIVKLLLEHDGPKLDYSAATEAVKEGRLSTIKLTFQLTAMSPSFNDNRFIRISAQYGHEEMVSYLLNDPRVKWKDRNFEALREAHRRGKAGVVKVLLDHFVKHTDILEEEERLARTKSQSALEMLDSARLGYEGRRRLPGDTLEMAQERDRMLREMLDSAREKYATARLELNLVLERGRLDRVVQEEREEEEFV